MINCTSCQANIPPEWVACIQSNSCPGCGGEIMNSETKELLAELSEAMQKMPNNPQGVAGWLVSNYHFRKIGDAQPVEKFHEKKDPKQLQGAALNNDFFRRAGVDGKVQDLKSKAADRGNKLAQLATLVNEVDEHMYGDGNSHIDADRFDEDEEEEVYQEQGPKISSMLASDAEMVIDPRVEAPSPEDLAKIKGLVEGFSGEPSQGGEIQAVLEKDRFKRIKAQSALMGGGGSFRR